MTTAIACDPATSVTRSLLGYGVIAGPIYVGVSLTEALTRTGFDLTRHSWSLLSNGGPGWIHITLFLLTGAMVVAFAVGLGRATGSAWAARLVGAFGVGLIAAGIFRADPAFGFPVGTPSGPGTVSWHGALHLACASAGFLCLVAAAVILARRLAAAGERGWSRYTLISAVAFLAGFVGIASGGGAAWSVVTFIAGVLTIFTWMSGTAVHLYRRVAR
jgi:hypothetical protein